MQGNVHTHMQKRVALPPFGQEILVQGGIRVFHQFMVLRVLLDDMGNDLLHGLHGEAVLLFTPGFGEDPTHLRAVIGEHGGKKKV